MNTTLMPNSYSAERKSPPSTAARPKPAAHSGGMSEVATATPEMRVAGSWSRELPSPPAKPPTSASSRSHAVGLELSVSAWVMPATGEKWK